MYVSRAAVVTNMVSRVTHNSQTADAGSFSFLARLPASLSFFAAALCTPLDEDDLENFYIRNLSRFVPSVYFGFPWAPRGSQGAPRGSQRAPKGSLGWGGVSLGLELMVIVCVCVPFSVTVNCLS